MTAGARPGEPGNRSPGVRRPGTMRWFGLGVLALMVIGCVGCGGGRGSTAQPGGDRGDDLVGRTFLATSATEGGKPRDLVAGTTVSLWFADDGRLVANAGCNTMSGPVRLDAGRVDVDGDLSMTEMGCDAPRHAQDAWLSEFLAAAPSWRLDGDELVITSPRAELVLLDRAVARPDPALEGTKWLLDTIYQADTASSVPAGAIAHLSFADGQVTGSTGCNMLSGTATVAESSITFGALTMTRKACQDDLASVERAMVTVLRGDVPFEIEAGQLVLNPGGRQGLGFRG